MATIREGSPISRKLFQMAYDSKKAALWKGDISKARLGGLWDALVFSKLKAKLGGEVQFLTTGNTGSRYLSFLHILKYSSVVLFLLVVLACNMSTCSVAFPIFWSSRGQLNCCMCPPFAGASPMSSEIFEFMKICFGANVIEAYGMTETACTITMTHPQDTLTGHVGPPVPCCEVKLVDIPEMGYSTQDQPHPRWPPHSSLTPSVLFVNHKSSSSSSSCCCCP